MKKVFTALIKVIFSLLLLIGGGLLGISTYYNAILGLDGENWITAPATITSTYTAQIYGSRTGNSGVEFVPHVTYTFVATDGKTYTGQLYSTNASTKRSGVTEEMLKYPTVEQGTIYYNPKDPNQSAVKQPIFDPATSFFFMLFGAILVFGGGYLFFDTIKPLFERSKA